MFVGEAGCWLIVGLYSLYTTFLSKRAGYTRIPPSTTSESPVDDEETNLALKPLVPKLDKHGRRSMHGWPILLLALPAICDICGTTLMNVGLLFVAASIYQMTRGALVLFVGIFSVIFLRHKLGPTKWLSLMVVTLGVMIVGLAGALQAHPQHLPGNSKRDLLLSILSRQPAPEEPVDHSEAVWTIIGVLMIAGGQIFTATQFVFEEHILAKYSINPTLTVAWEGTFGFLITILGMIVLHLTIGRTEAGRHHYFDAVEGWHQFTHNPAIFSSSLLIMLSIGGFNFFGLSVTRIISATSRSTIDTCRTLFIWIVSLGLGWETFKWLQVVGFVLLVYGTFLFNDLIAAPWQRCVRERASPEIRLGEDAIEHS